MAPCTSIYMLDQSIIVFGPMTPNEAKTSSYELMLGFSTFMLRQSLKEFTSYRHGIIAEILSFILKGTFVYKVKSK